MRFFQVTSALLLGLFGAQAADLIAAESSVRPMFYKSSALAAYQAATAANSASVNSLFSGDAWASAVPRELATAATEMDEAYSAGYGNTMAYGTYDAGYGDMNSGYGMAKDINVYPKHKPITLHYRTHSQPIMVHQTRIPGPKPEVKHTMTHEEPHRVVHQVVRPIIQEVHEIIQPYRRIVQQVQPVQEEIQTIVAKDSRAHTGAGAMVGGASAGTIGGEMSDSYASGSKQIYRRSPAVMTVAQTQQYEEKVERPRTLINKAGIPVYHSNYGGGALPPAQY